jgi:hypothetical protein
MFERPKCRQIVGKEIAWGFVKAGGTIRACSAADRRHFAGHG